MIRQRSFATPEAENRSLERRRRLAESLMASQGGPPGIWNAMPVTPTYGVGNALADAGAKIGGALLQKKTDQRQAELDEEKRKKLAQTLMGQEGQPDFMGPPDPRREAAANTISTIAPQLGEQMAAQQAIETLMPPKPVYERVDLGDRIGLMDINSGQIVEEFAKGNTPDAVLGAGVTTRGQDLSYDATTRGQDMSYDSTTRGQDISAQTAANAQAMQERLANAKTATDAGEQYKSSEGAWNVWQVARNGLAGAMADTWNFPGMGLMPNLTDAQRKAAGARAQLAPVLKSMFRTAGEGTFTDKDQELLLAMIPDEGDGDEVAAWKLSQMDQLIMAKLGLTPQGAGYEGPSASEMTNSLATVTGQTGVVDFSNWK